LIADTHCLVVVTLGVGREPRSLVFRRFKRVLPLGLGAGAIEPHPAPSVSSNQKIIFDKWPWAHSLSLARSMIVSPVAPTAPAVSQLWSTGVKSDKYPKLARVLRWDGADWVTTAGYVFDSPIIMKHGKQACDFQEALAFAHGQTELLGCEFIYTYDGSTWGMLSRIRRGVGVPAVPACPSFPFPDREGGRDARDPSLVMHAADPAGRT
jgi:hypothetical protein